MTGAPKLPPTVELSFNNIFLHDPYIAETLLPQGAYVDETHLRAYPEMNGILRQNLARYKNACTYCAGNNAVCVYYPPQTRPSATGTRCVACRYTKHKCSNVTPGLDIDRDVEFVYAPHADEPAPTHATPSMAIRVNFLDDMIRRQRLQAWPCYLESEGPKKGAPKRRRKPRPNEHSALYRAPPFGQSASFADKRVVTVDEYDKDEWEVCDMI
ncbi:hypothetical protein PENSPDRAFT_363981 [Peniophora sp. CONT]|nr:hypothetical protein PENSPDRAFT_363981 [Peniophora sp. CONT]